MLPESLQNPAPELMPKTGKEPNADEVREDVAKLKPASHPRVEKAERDRDDLAANVGKMAASMTLQSDALHTSNASLDACSIPDD